MRPLLAKVSATPDECRRPLPGDHLVASAAATVTHAVTIAAGPDKVWPWLAQMGAGRAGWYSYDWLDNGGQSSLWEIDPSLQALRTGDIMPSVPGATISFVVAAADARRDLILTVSSAGGDTMVSWEFFLDPLPDGCGTRLLVRGRVSPSWPLGGPREKGGKLRLIEAIYALLGRLPRWLMTPIAMFGHGVMQARQLRGLKSRAEHVTGNLWRGAAGPATARSTRC